MAEKDGNSTMATEESEEKGFNRKECSPTRYGKSRSLTSVRKMRKSAVKKDDWPKKNYFQVSCLEMGDGGATKMVRNRLLGNQYSY